MLQWEHSAILLTIIKLPFVRKTSILEWLFNTGFTVIPLTEILLDNEAQE